MSQNVKVPSAVKCFTCGVTSGSWHKHSDCQDRRFDKGVTEIEAALHVFLEKQENDNRPAQN